MAFAVADREVSALEFRVFVEVSEPQVVPMNYFIWNDEAQVVRCVLVSTLSSIIALPLINDFPGFALGVLVLELLTAAVQKLLDCLGAIMIL